MHSLPAALIGVAFAAALIVIWDRTVAALTIAPLIVSGAVLVLAVIPTIWSMVRE